MKHVWLFALLALGGCATRGPTSVSGDECRVFERPPYAVRGARPYDQEWIDSTVEGGVGACGWQRPAARPASLDASPAPVLKAKAKSPQHRVKGWVRFLHFLHHKKQAVAPEAVPAFDPPPPAPPKRPIDELLGTVQ